MTESLEIAFDSWCRYALDLPNLDQVHLRQAFAYREELRQALAGGLALDDEEVAALRTADAAFEREAAYILPRLTYAGWLDRQSEAHYARAYVARHQ